jgi:murein L,D-transpeptidase YafK
MRLKGAGGLKSMLRSVGVGLILGAGLVWFKMKTIGDERVTSVRERVEPGLIAELEERGLRYGSPVFLRAFKESAELELWLEKKPGQPWELYRSWPIAAWSGQLGPKLKEGDYQTPEGFYAVGKGQLNPRSTFHLSFNVGYPNGYDRHRGRTGSHIMVHGSNVSVGCLAMTDPVIEVIYLLVEAALARGQEAVPVHLLPFRLTAERMQAAEGEDWYEFWQQDLWPVAEAFEKSRVPPKVEVEAGGYRLSGEVDQAGR